MDSPVDHKPEGFRETRILIANGMICAKQAALQRVQVDLNILLERQARIEAEIYEAKEKRDRLILERWRDKQPEWPLILGPPIKHSQILAERGEEEVKRLGLFSAGYFEKSQQKALGVAVPGETTDKQLSFIATSLETVFPHLYAVTDGEAAVIVSHNEPESFSLQIRQLLSNSSISVCLFSYGRKEQFYFDDFLSAITFIRNNMTGNRFKYEATDGFSEVK